MKTKRERAPTDPAVGAQFLRFGGQAIYAAGVAAARRIEGLCIKCGLVAAGPPAHICQPCATAVGHGLVDTLVNAAFRRRGE